MTKDPRGGARPGSGRKLVRLNEHLILKMLENADAYEMQFGKSIDMILLDIMYSIESKDRDRIAAIKIFYDLLARGQQDEGEIQHMGPSIYLPEKRPDPAKMVQSEVH